MLICSKYRIQICHNYRTVINPNYYFHKNCKIITIFASWHVWKTYAWHTEIAVLRSSFLFLCLLCDIFSHSIPVRIWSKRMTGMKGRVREVLSTDSQLYLYKADNVMTWFLLWRNENLMSTTTLSGTTLLHFRIPSWRSLQRLEDNGTSFWKKYKLNNKLGWYCREKLVENKVASVIVTSVQHKCIVHWLHSKIFSID